MSSAKNNIFSNTASIDGGGIYINGGDASIEQYTVIGDISRTTVATASSYSNKANYGAGIYINNGDWKDYMLK